MKKLLITLIFALSVFTQVKRLPNANVYNLGNGVYRAEIGGAIKNVPTEDGSYAPVDCDLRVITGHPIVQYVVKQAGAFVGFHNKSTNRYLAVVKLYSGESLVKTIVGSIECTPTIKSNKIIEWEYPNGSWVREYRTFNGENGIKEVIHQKAGQVIRFRYQLDGLTAKNNGTTFGIYRSDTLVFSIQRPYYCNIDQEFLAWVPITWENVSGDWIVTYPAVATDRYIDPTLIFGEGSGQGSTGYNKDSGINKDNPDIALATRNPIVIRSGVKPINYISRYELSDIPTTAKISSAVVSIKQQIFLAAGNYSIHALLTDWGQTKTSAGAEEHPATAGQATWDNSFDYDGVSDVGWADGVDAGFGSNDYTAVAEDAQTIPATNATVNFSVTSMVKDMVSDSTNNFGFVILSDAGGSNNAIFSFDAASDSDKPYLTVTYSLSSGPNRRAWNRPKWRRSWMPWSRKLVERQ